MSVAQTKEFVDKYPQVKIATANDYGGWATIQQKFFNDNAIFAKILRSVNTAKKDEIPTATLQPLIEGNETEEPQALALVAVQKSINVCGSYVKLLSLV